MSIVAVPPRAAVLLSLGAVLPLLGALVLGGWLGGGVAVLGMVLGSVTVSAAATAAVPGWLRLAITALAGLALWAGVVVSDLAWAAALVAAAFVLLMAPLNERSAGLGVMLPVLAAIGASEGEDLPVPATAGWVVAGALLTIGLALVLHAVGPARPVPRRLAVRHAVVTAVAAGLGLYLMLSLGIDHGYWMMLTLVVVLRPVPYETGQAIRDRVAGTLVGVFVAIAVVLLLPTPVALAAGVLCLVLTVAWAVAGDVRRQMVYATPLVILAASSGLAGPTVDQAANRLLLTLAGGGVAAALAALLHRSDPAEPDLQFPRT